MNITAAADPDFRVETALLGLFLFYQLRVRIVSVIPLLSELIPDARHADGR